MSSSAENSNDRFFDMALQEITFDQSDFSELLVAEDSSDSDFNSFFQKNFNCQSVDTSVQRQIFYNCIALVAGRVAFDVNREINCELCLSWLTCPPTHAQECVLLSNKLEISDPKYLYPSKFLMKVATVAEEVLIDAIAKSDSILSQNELLKILKSCALAKSVNIPKTSCLTHILLIELVVERIFLLKLKEFSSNLNSNSLKLFLRQKLNRLSHLNNV